MTEALVLGIALGPSQLLVLLALGSLSWRVSAVGLGLALLSGQVHVLGHRHIVLVERSDQKAVLFLLRKLAVTSS